VTGILIDCVYEVDLLASFRKILLVCINQDDLAERAGQVKLMGQIYRNAEVVVVWLGRDSPELSAFKWATTTLLQKLDSFGKSNPFPHSIENAGGPLQEPNCYGLWSWID
jgi:hypothetical protein